MADPYWARRVYDAKSVLHCWAVPFEGCESFISACDLQAYIPAYYGPWPSGTWPNSFGDRCEQCETLVKLDRDASR